MEASAKLKKIVRILPHDVIIGILAKLPVKLLLRFRCVCRLWCSLIFEPHFIQRHRLEHAEKNPDIFFIAPHNRMLYHYSLEEGRRDAHELPKGIPEYKFSLSHCCHGLFLLSERERIHVYNPATRQLITLPEASLHIPLYTTPIQNVGLGYDNFAKEYKIVHFFNSQFYGTKYHMECEIFTMGLSDLWKRVGSIPYPLIHYDPVLVNGALHWMVDNRFLMNRSALIVSVNLSDENISIIPHPRCCLDSNKNWMYMWLVQLGGCLSLVDTSTEPLMDIWMLQDYTKSTWIRAYSIDMLNINGYINTYCYIIPIAIHSNGNILISLNVNQLSEYNPRTKTVTNYEGYNYRFLGLRAYTESLVPLRRK